MDLATNFDFLFQMMKTLPIILLVLLASAFALGSIVLNFNFVGSTGMYPYGDM